MSIYVSRVWNDTTRVYTEYNSAGAQTLSRPYNVEENAAADARAIETRDSTNESTINNKIVTVDMLAMDAILAQTNADLRTDPSQEIKDMAKAIRRLDRKVLELLDGTE